MSPQTDEGGNVKVTLWMTPKAMAAVEEASRTNGDSHTDTINRAVQIYNQVGIAMERAWDNGGHIVVHYADGTTERFGR